ncbi:C-type lectin domain family 4 member F-like [Cheilinus undulatus]|uniref:C-type lectin domain family 4 member F-like n=1 Tax=Cheilinus undulatus TaxID=241271 RepID=UPI001BD1CBEA|nr:C-type lectin domain family 4 member F-like [Cheilinus undulatus]
MMPRPSGPVLYRLATICLATLCTVLLISIIAITAHYKNKPQGSSEATAEAQKQSQVANVSALTASINKLKKEKQQLQKERDDLQKERDDLQKERDDLQKERDDLQKERNDLQKERDDLQKERDDLQKERDDLLKERDELQAKLATKPTPQAPDVVRPTTKAPIICPPDWQIFNDSCYFISRNSRSWPESQSFCESKGAHLAIIHTPEEQTFLWDLLPRGHWNAYWFGITDGHTEDVWKWVDGTPLVGGFWEEGEPNNHINEDCGYIVKTYVLERVAIRSWYDAPCSMYWPFICEKEMGV